MFRLFSRNTTPGSELLLSQLYDESTFYKALYKDIAKAKRSVVIESPFLTIRRARIIAPTLKKLRRRNVVVTINTRLPRHHTPKLQLEAEEAIVVLKSAGVKVYVCNDLRHRKLAIIDSTILWEGSLNILSQSNSREVMRRIESTKLCKQMLRFTRLESMYR